MLNYDFFSDFAYTANSIYIQANDLVNAIEGMLNSNKLESENVEKKYQDMISLAKQIAIEIKIKFDSVLNMFKMGGRYISDLEQRTLDKLSIYHPY